MAILGPDITQARIASGLQFFQESWSALLDVAVGTWLLQRQLSWACIAPVVVVLAFVGITSRISRTTNIRQRAWIEKVQERLKVTTDILGDIKSIKMLGISSTASTLLQDVRRDEIESSSSYRRILLSVIVVSSLPSLLVPTVTFAMFAITSMQWRESSLNVQQAFSSLALITLFTTPVMAFTQTLPRVIQAFGCFSRVQEYCNYSCSDPNAAIDTDGEISCESPLESGASVKLKGKTYRWKLDGPVILKNPDIEIEPGTIVAVVGSVGSGKTTMLVLLGETIDSSAGHCRQRRRAAAYCSQTPWLENRTIRDNILGNLDYDIRWYEAVLHACELETDIASQADGDITLVGSKGIGLSGGQKQRIALARAIYSRSSLLLLDDVFSGMDSRTVDTVSRRLLGTDGLFRQHATTVVLVAANKNVIALVDKVIALNKGEIVDIAPPDKLLKDHVYIGVFGLDNSDDIPDSTPAQCSARKTVALIPQVKQPGGGDDRRKKGDFSAYSYYIRNGGFPAFMGTVLSRAATVFLTFFSTIWLKWWSEADASLHNNGLGMYLGVYILLGMLSVGFTFLCGWFLFVRLISQSSDRFHLDLLQATLRAPFWFLSSIDTGNLMNRFSQDLEIIDLSLPGSVYNTIGTILSCLSRLLILLFFSPYLVLILPFFAAAVYFLQKLNLRTARQVRLLAIEVKAPLFTSFMDSVAGATTIRAFGWQSGYQKRICSLIDQYQRPKYVQSCLLYWLTFVLDVVLAVVAVLLVAAIVYWPASFAEGNVGVSLLMMVGFSRTVMSVGTTWATMASSMGAVSRIKAFVEETPEETEKYDNDPAWLHLGRISFENLEIAHTLEGVSVLRKISLIVEPKQHIAICGRTGSGKTSLLLATLAMAIVKEGAIIIDGIDTKSLSPEQLRRAINVVPQDPLIIPRASVRANVDPYGRASDDEIERVLRRVGLWDEIVAKGGATEEMVVSAWSMGQKQLLCLARAMTRKSKLVVLDEAMSNVDAETEAVMQDIVDTEFQDVTVLAVMHRLHQVARYDKVALLDQGELVEFDDPRTLLSREGSKFAALYKASEK